ncbi:MAG TPA: substrate-binding domain-containing protein [Alloacidobacterium sp.]|nr:substrate-binding domain-containing protein [Alloacidobacterium sp.]
MKSRVSALPSTRRCYTIRAVARAAATLKAFSSSAEVLSLTTVVERTQLDKGTVFRLLETLVEAGLIIRAGKHGYQSALQPIRTKRFRIGYASQSNLLAFTGIVTDSLLSAASRADIELVVLNNQFSPRIALENAKRFVEEKVDLVVDSQININIASQIGSTFLDAGIPFIAVDIPHPGSFYFGADNYKAGRIAGRHLARWALKHWQGEVEQVISLGVDAAGPLLNSRLTGMFDGLNEIWPEGRNVATCHYDTKGGQFDATLDTIRKHLRRRKVRRVLVGAVNDTTALAALQGFREVGLEQECAIVGQDANVDARQEMRRPSTRLLGSVAYFPETYGAQIIKLAIEILEKKPTPPAVFTQHELVTPQNVDKIYPNDAWILTGAKLTTGRSRR